MLRPTKCKSCGKMQQAGEFKINVAAAAAPTITDNDFLPEQYSTNKVKKIKDNSANYLAQGVANGIIEDPENIYSLSQEKSSTIHNPFNKMTALNGATLGMQWLSGLAERNRQDNWDINKMSQLGQMNPMPASDYQPNPFSLYAKFGGKLMKKAGLTPNDARQILHDGTAQGHELTDKQRRFFGAMSKGHTNFKGK